MNHLRQVVSSLIEEWRVNEAATERPQLQSPEITVNRSGDLQGRESISETSNYQTSNKRRRTESINQDRRTSSTQLPPDDLINAILDAYFSVVHPFVPIIHEMLFRARLRDPTERPKLLVVLHAMMVCAMRYVANERLALADRCHRHTVGVAVHPPGHQAD